MPTIFLWNVRSRDEPLMLWPTGPPFLIIVIFSIAVISGVWRVHLLILVEDNLFLSILLLLLSSITMKTATNLLRSRVLISWHRHDAAIADLHSAVSGPALPTLYRFISNSISWAIYFQVDHHAFAKLNLVNTTNICRFLAQIWRVVLTLILILAQVKWFESLLLELVCHGLSMGLISQRLSCLLTDPMPSALAAHWLPC